MNGTQSVRLKRWAHDHDMTYDGAIKAFHRGAIPGAYQLPSGTILVALEAESTPSDGITKAATYARVSTRKQAENLERQSERLREFVTANGWILVHSEAEIASGLNENRRKLLALMADASWDVLVVEYRDRLARFGTRWIEEWAKATGRRVVYMNTVDDDDDTASLVEDLVAITSSFIGRVHGKRGAKAKAQALVERALL